MLDALTKYRHRRIIGFVNPAAVNSSMWDFTYFSGIVAFYRYSFTLEKQHLVAEPPDMVTGC